MAEAVYILCAVTSILCSVLLLRGWLKSRSRLLFWSSLCFAGLALNNVLLFVDLVLTAGTTISLGGVELPLIRNVVALVAVFVLVFGLVWECR